MNILTKILYKRRKWVTNKTKGFLTTERIFNYITSVNTLHRLRTSEKLPTSVLTIRLLKKSK